MFKHSHLSILHCACTIYCLIALDLKAVVQVYSSVILFRSSTCKKFNSPILMNHLCLALRVHLAFSSSQTFGTPHALDFPVKGKFNSTSLNYCCSLVFP